MTLKVSFTVELVYGSLSRANFVSDDRGRCMMRCHLMLLHKAENSDAIDQYRKHAVFASQEEPCDFEQVWKSKLVERNRPTI